MPKERIKILFLASNPTDISRIRLDEELREIDERISLSSYREQFELIPHFAVRPRDLMRGLVKHQPHILHFSGHGSTSAGIVLEDNQGKTKLVAAADIAELISIVKDNLRVVVLNSCYSALQAGGIAETIDCVIGMNDKVGDSSAIIFSATFYENLAFGRSVEEAFRLGVMGLKTEGSAGATIPTLLTKHGVDLAKVYLTSHKKGSSTPEKPNGSAQGTNKVIHLDHTNVKAGNDVTIANH